MKEIDLSKLKEPFNPNDIEWRVQQSGIKNGKVWAMVLAYITNRAVQDRLDEVCGAENWQDEFQIHENGVICKLSIKINGEWIPKSDGAHYTDIESFKGGISDAEKRAAVKFGIGRYLYNLPVGFADITESGRYRGKAKDKKTNKEEWFKWNPPELPDWALPEASIVKPKKEKEDSKVIADKVSQIIDTVEKEKKIIGEDAAKWYTEENIISHAKKDVAKNKTSMLAALKTMHERAVKHIEETKTAQSAQGEIF